MTMLTLLRNRRPGRRLLPSLYRKARLTVLALALAALPLTAAAGFSISRGSDVGAVSEAGQAAGVEWHYTVRSGETLEQIGHELLAGHISPQRLAGYNSLHPQILLAAGDTVRIPVAWLQQQPHPASLTAVSGQVQVRTASTGRLRHASAGERVHAGDTIITRQGSATVELADGSRIRINPSSQIMFNRLTRYGREGMTDTRMRLEHGRISNRIRPTVEGGARFEVETPSAIAAVRGTAFAMHSDARGSRIKVTEGEVTFGQPGQTRIIPAGYGAAIGPGMTDPAIRRLPPAPQTQPVPDTVVQFPLELEWAPTGAGQYLVEVLNADTGEWVQGGQTRDPRFALSNLSNGHYQVEIAALSPDGISGQPSVSAFQVDLAARAASLLSPESGAALDEDNPLFQWQPRGDHELARVEVARSPAFNSLLAHSEWTTEPQAQLTGQLPAGQYHWRVVTEAGATSVATSETRSLVINGMLPPVRVLSTNYIDRQVRIFWETIEGASGYHLQLSENPSFREILKEVNVNDTTAALRLIPGRRYFVRLKAVSDGPVAGRWGPGRELFIE